MLTRNNTNNVLEKLTEESMGVLYLPSIISDKITDESNACIVFPNSKFDFSIIESQIFENLSNCIPYAATNLRSGIDSYTKSRVIEYEIYDLDLVNPKDIKTLIISTTFLSNDDHFRLTLSNLHKPPLSLKDYNENYK